MKNLCRAPGSTYCEYGACSSCIYSSFYNIEKYAACSSCIYSSLYNIEKNELEEKELNFDEYQIKSRKTAIYPKLGESYVYPLIGMNGECGELTEKIKKILRDKNGKWNNDDTKGISKEIGDILWYAAQVATEFDLSLNNIAKENLEKLQNRQKRDKIHGSGDNR